MQEEPELTAQNEEQEPPKEPQQTAPPWGSDEEFNPEKAWRLIQNLRSEVGELKPKAQKLADFEDAQKSEHERLQEQLETAKADSAKAAVQAARYRAAMKHGLDDDDLDLLGDDPEQIETRAERLAARIAAAAPEPAASPSRRPQERLRPGASPDAEPQASPKEIAAALFKNH